MMSVTSVRVKRATADLRITLPSWQPDAGNGGPVHHSRQHGDWQPISIEHPGATSPLPSIKQDPDKPLAGNLCRPYGDVDLEVRESVPHPGLEAGLAELFGNLGDVGIVLRRTHLVEGVSILTCPLCEAEVLG